MVTEADAARRPLRRRERRAERHHKTLRRRVGGAFGALAGVLAILFVITGLAMTDAISKGNDVVYRWEPAVTRSQGLLSDLVNQETGVRGYALSGQAGLLDPYTQYRAQQDAAVARLRTLLKSRRDLLTRLQAVIDTAAEWQRLTAERVIAQVRAGGSGSGPTLIAADDRMRFDLIRQRAAELTSAVNSASADARHARQNSLDIVVTTLIITGAVVVVAAYAAWRALQNDVLKPMDNLASQARAVTDGQLNRVIRPSG